MSATTELLTTAECRLAGSLESGSAMGPYTIHRVIGRGGMGAVYEATHKTLRKQVAIKVLRPDPAAGNELIERFVREGRAASSIRHPHVVDVTDIGEHDGLVYLVMEFLEGMSLQEYRRAKKRLSVEETLEILLPILSGVAAAHDRGIVHRDLKPANLFLTHDRRNGRLHPMVLDFGVAKTRRDNREQETLTRTSAVVGTPQYLSPEQARDSKQVEHFSDQYSLAVVIYECLTGTPPFAAYEGLLHILNAIVSGSFQKPRQLCPQIPEELESIILRAMSLYPESRYPDLRAFGKALLPFAEAHTRSLFRVEFADAPVTAPEIRSDIAIDIAIDLADSNSQSGTTVAENVRARSREETRAASPVALSVPTLKIRPAPRRRWGLAVLAAAVCIPATAVVYHVWNGVEQQDQPARFHVEPPNLPRASEENAEAPLDSEQSAESPAPSPTTRTLAPIVSAEPRAAQEDTTPAEEEARTGEPPAAVLNRRRTPVPARHEDSRVVPAPSPGELADPGPSTPMIQRGANRAPLIE